MCLNMIYFCKLIPGLNMIMDMIMDMIDYALDLVFGGYILILIDMSI